MKIARIAAAASLFAAHSAFAFFTFPFYTSIDIEEWTHDASGRFRLISDAGEKAAYAAGLVEPGWRRTGRDIGTATGFSGPWSILPVLHPTCRFHNRSAGTHLFTANALECDTLRANDLGWSYEGTSFAVQLPVEGRCGYVPSYPTSPVHRLYNNRRGGRANHRFTADAQLRARLVAEGWADEGIAFCALAGWRSIENTWSAMATAVPGACRVGCIVTSNLPALALGRALPYLSPPRPPPPLYAATAWEQFPTELFAATASNDEATLLQSTYVQAIDRARHVNAGFGPLGIHIASHDRLQDGVASIALRRELDPASDGRTTPWQHGRDSELTAGMSVGFGEIATQPGGHAYGFPALQFRDSVSGHRLLVTLQAFGTKPAGDFTGFDSHRGVALVSIELKAQPAVVGRPESEGYRRCSGGECAREPYEYRFRFVMGREDFAQFVARARGVDPQLSPDPADYALEAFECRVEVAGDALIGATIRGCGVSMTY